MLESVQARIEKLETILSEGLSSVMTDGQSASYDLAEVRRELERLKRIADPNSRPRSAQINLGGF